MCVVTKRLRLESRSFRYKVARYLSYLQIKFDDEIERKSLRILSIISELPLSKVKLTSKLRFMPSDVAVTETCNTNVWQRTNV